MFQVDSRQQNQYGKRANRANRASEQSKLSVMKFKLYPRSQSDGGVMLVALFLCMLLGVGIGSYLMLVRAQARNVGRSQDWNRALTVAEAGVEEALAQLNPGIGPAADLTAHGWGAPSGGFYGPKTRFILNDSYTVTYTTDIAPIIYSTGWVASADSTLARVIQARTTNTPLFTLALGAKLNIDMKGNGLTTDSFDSGKTNLSINGIYDLSRASTNGDIASLGGEVNLGNHVINGDLYLGPTAAGGGNVLGTTYHDFNADFPDVVLPIPLSSFANAPVSSTPINGTTYTYCLTNSGYYNLPVSGNIFVAAGAKVVLYSAALLHNIYVAGTGTNAGNLQIYLAAPSFSGGASSESRLAEDLGVWGLPTCKTISFSGNSEFTGTIYAPEAALTLSGGGSSDLDLCGSFVANSVTVTGHFKCHYDEALMRNGPSRGFAVSSWREL
jgi:hypothetical protein